MMKHRRGISIAAALIAPFAAFAQDGELEALTQPSGEYRLGGGLRTDDGKRANQYLGLRENFTPALDFDLSRRNEQTGEWLTIRGQDLATDARALRIENRLQGDWGYFLDYSQTPRLTPYTVNTSVRGIGTANLTIPYPAATPKSATELRTQRDALVGGAEKSWDTAWNLQVRVRHEEKTGERLFSRGTTGGTGGHEFTPEPIQYATQEAEATLNYTRDRLQLAGGYYGSWFSNTYSGLSINNQPGGPTALGTGAGAFTPIALPPNNMSHLFHLAGGYNYTPTTRLTFKVSNAYQTQQNSFIVAPVATLKSNNLDGRIQTTRLQAGIFSRPLKNLTLRADLRYEDRDDQTPERAYRTAGLLGTDTTNGYNEPRSFKTTVGKAEAAYALPAGFRVTGGADYEQKWRNYDPVRVVSQRATTEENTVRVELRRSLSETVNGALGLAQSNRTGSPWATTTTLNGANGSNLVSPLHLADRDRDKLRAVLDWAPFERLSLNFVAEQANDTYSGRVLGPRRGEASTYSADAALTLAEGWQVTGWYSVNDTRAEQVTCENAAASNTGALGACPNTAADPIWQAKLRTVTDAFGLGLRARPGGKVEYGGDFSYTRDRNEFKEGRLPVPNPVGTSGGGLPDVHYSRMIFGLYSSYAFDKASGLRLRYTLDVFRSDDYNWNSWTYTDGTTVRQDPVQKVQFVGVTFYQRFR